MSRLFVVSLGGWLMVGGLFMLAGCQKNTDEMEKVKFVQPALHQQIQLTRATIHVPQ